MYALLEISKTILVSERRIDFPFKELEEIPFQNLTRVIERK